MNIDVMQWLRGQIEIVGRMADSVAESIAPHDMQASATMRDVRYLCNRANRLVEQKSAKCPTCNSFDRTLHPAMQYEGEVQECSDPWHKRMKAGGADG